MKYVEYQKRIGQMASRRAHGWKCKRCEKFFQPLKADTFGEVYQKIKRHFKSSHKPVLTKLQKNWKS
jgi:predicted small metal-binding protein